MAEKIYPCPSCGQGTTLDDEEEIGFCSVCGAKLRNFGLYVVLFEEERQPSGGSTGGGSGEGPIGAGDDLVGSMVNMFVKAVKFWK